MFDEAFLLLFLQPVPQIEAVEESGTAFSEVVEQVKIEIACAGLL